MRSIEEVQLPLILTSQEKPKRRNIKGFLDEVLLLDRSGISRSRIAEMMDVSRSILYKLFDAQLSNPP